MIHAFFGRDYAIQHSSQVILITFTPPSLRQRPHLRIVKSYLTGSGRTYSDANRTIAGGTISYMIDLYPIYIKIKILAICYNGNEVNLTHTLMNSLIDTT